MAVLWDSGPNIENFSKGLSNTPSFLFFFFLNFLNWDGMQMGEKWMHEKNLLFDQLEQSKEWGWWPLV